MNSVDNRKHLFLRLFLGSILVPAFGIVPAILTAVVPPVHGPPWSVSARLAFAGAFVAAGAAICVYALWKVPVRVDLSDVMTVRYVFRTWTIRADEIRDVTIEDRSVTLRSRGSLPMTAQDTLLTIRLTDGQKLTLSLPPATAVDFRNTVLRWRQV
jgi:hypothetical protein